MGLPPVAFLSYAHSDDEDGCITRFCKRLTAEVHKQTGRDFPIFQDRNDISWGQTWRERIEEGLDAATFFIAIVTPSYLNSDYCRRELERFLERERKLKRNDLVLPVYYVDTPLLREEGRLKADALAAAIAAHQWVDWQDLRFEPLTTPRARRALARIAAQVREALARTAGGATAAAAVPKPARRPPARRRASPTPAEDATAPETAAATPKASAHRTRAARTGPPTLVVSQMSRGDYATISEAIAAADPGARILVQPGRYEEGLVIDKPLEIVGDGNRDDIVVQATGASAVLFKTTVGRVANLTLRQAGGRRGGKWLAVDITHGRLELEDCDISSKSQTCVAVHGGADPRIRRNRIHDGENIGVYVYGSGLGVLEDNDISGNGLAGLAVRDGGNPTLWHNRIHDGHFDGVYVYDDGLGLLEDNDIFGNALAGIMVQSGGNLTARQNRINRNRLVGVVVGHGGSGIFEGNDLRGNASGPWLISEDSVRNVRRGGNIEK